MGASFVFNMGGLRYEFIQMQTSPPLDNTPVFLADTPVFLADTALFPPVVRPSGRGGRVIYGNWFVLLCAAVFAAPGLVALGRDVWTTEQGAHGPIILATGLWLLWHEGAFVTRRPGHLGAACGWIALVGAVMVFAAIIGKLWLQWAASYLGLLGVLYACIGRDAMRRLWFPLCYLMFLVPPPQGIIVPLTRALKLGIADWSVSLLAAAGYEVAKSGASLFIDSYELVVAAACSGLNSLVSLLAVGLFYVYLRHRANWHYAALIGVLIVPVALLANLLRVVILLLITHYAGIEVAQGVLHDATGLMTFFIALGSLIVLDLALEPFAARWMGGGRHG